MRKTFTIGLAGVSAAALTLGLAGTASADVAPRPADVVGVGSDTVQYVADFVADGDNKGNPGYNTLNTARRVISFDATADAGGKAFYSQNYTTGAAVAATAKIVLRAGDAPVNRPNGSGSGISALIADTGATHKINFVRSSRLPKAAEQTAATAAANVGALHSYQIATDGLGLGVAATTNAPAGGITCGDLAGVYGGSITTWNQLTGNGAGSTATIVPIIPQAGSGTRSDFESQLKACNGGTAVTLANPNMIVGEEHDATAIQGNPNAVGPFSIGRYNLIQSGYLGAGLVNAVTILPGGPTTATAADNFFVARKLYIIVRESDVNSATPMQVGGSLNFVKTLFGSSTAYFAKASNSGLFTNSGVTQAWVDALNTTSG